MYNFWVRSSWGGFFRVPGQKVGPYAVQFLCWIVNFSPILFYVLIRLGYVRFFSGGSGRSAAPMIRSIHSTSFQYFLYIYIYKCTWVGQDTYKCGENKIYKTGERDGENYQ
jgi:hypothetical protein